MLWIKTYRWAIVGLFKSEDRNITVQKVLDGNLRGMKFEDRYLKTPLISQLNQFSI